YGWLWHYQVGLEIFSAERRGVEIWKHQSVGRVGQRRRVACLVLPGLEVHCLSRADAKQYPQDLWTGDSLSQRWVEAVAPLLDKGEMESRRVGDRLNMGRRV